MAPRDLSTGFQFLDGDGSQYITSNTLDEVSHAAFLNAYLESKGADPVNFDEFRTLRGSQATGARDIGRLTNLMHLDVDTSWYIRYRSKTNPDFGATYPQAINIRNRTAIPRTDDDFEDADHIQAIANTAAFHFGSIEQGGASLYPALGEKVTSLEVLKISSVLADTRSPTSWNGWTSQETQCKALRSTSRTLKLRLQTRDSPFQTSTKSRAAHSSKPTSSSLSPPSSSAPGYPDVLPSAP